MYDFLENSNEEFDVDYDYQNRLVLLFGIRLFRNLLLNQEEDEFNFIVLVLENNSEFIFLSIDIVGGLNFFFLSNISRFIVNNFVDYQKNIFYLEVIIVGIFLGYIGLDKNLVFNFFIVENFSFYFEDFIEDFLQLDVIGISLFLFDVEGFRS